MNRPLFALVLVACLLPAMAQRTPVRTWLTPEKVTVLKSDEIDESSGIAPSLSQKDVYYTHNDSGDVARFFRFTLDGEVTGEFSLAGVKATDWEDMASARIGGNAYLYFGDIGDNQSKRQSVQVYRVPEPVGAGRRLDAFDAYTLKYPDKAHNCETLMVHPRTGDLWLVTKVNKGSSRVYMLPAPRRMGEFSMRFVGTVEVGTMIPGSQMITGGDISPDGKFVVLRSYTAAYEFAVPSKFENWIKSAPRRIDTTQEGQGEAICYARDGRSLMTTSEGSPCPVNRVRLKA
jgi:hypothetical protein